MAGPVSNRQQTGRSGVIRCIVITILAVIIVVGLAVLITWLIVRPKALIYTIETGKVSGFDLRRDHLNATFDVFLKAYNPNRRVALYYDSIEVVISYDDQTIAFQSLDPFFQRRHNVTMLDAKLKAQSVALQTSIAKDLRLEKSSGDIEVEVRLKAKIRFKVGVWKSSHYTLRVYCSNVEMHLNSTKNFKQKRCDVDT